MLLEQTSPSGISTLFALHTTRLRREAIRMGKPITHGPLVGCNL